MSTIIVKENRMAIVVYDLNYGFGYVAFKTKVFNRHGTFNHIVNKSLEDPSYVICIAIF